MNTGPIGVVYETDKEVWKSVWVRSELTVNCDHHTL